MYALLSLASIRLAFETAAVTMGKDLNSKPALTPTSMVYLDYGRRLHVTSFSQVLEVVMLTQGLNLDVGIWQH